MNSSNAHHDVSSTQTHPLERLIRSIARGPVLGLRGTIDLEGEQDMIPLPPFEDEVWKRRMDGDELPPIPRELIDAVGRSHDTLVFMDSLVPARHARIRVQTERGVLLNAGVVMQQALAAFAPGTTVCFLAPAFTLTHEKFDALRREIEETHGLVWVVLLGDLSELRMHHFPFTLLVCHVGCAQDDVVRLVDLREVDPTAWAEEVRSAAARRGGEVGHSIVLPRAQLRDGPWNYERYTKAYAASRADLTALGQLRPLGELVESIIVGLTAPRSPVRLQPVRNDELEPPPGKIHLLGGREVARTGIVTPGPYW